MSSYSIIIISDQILIKRWQEKEILGDSTKGKVHEKKSKKKLTSVSFMYVCVAENVELLVF